MSFILDALQKSETQRQRQLGPGLAAVRKGKRGRAIPVWVPLLAILLVVNIVILASLMWPGARTERVDAAPGSAGAGLPAGDPAEKRVAIPERRGEVRPLAAEASAASRKNGSPDSGPASTEIQPGSSGSVVVMTEQEMNEFLGPEETGAQVDAARAGSIAQPTMGQNTAAELLPALQELQLRGLTELPDLHLDVHVYSATVGERFVFVNMKKYREGERLREGPLLESITPQGIILQHNGRRFVLIQD